MKSSFSILSCIMPLVLYLKSHNQTQGHLDWLLCYLLNSLVLCFAFRYVLHFELIFVKGVRSASTFISLPVDVQLFLHHPLERLPFSTELPLLLVKDQLTAVLLICFWAPCSGSLVCFSSTTPHLGYCSFTVSLEIESVKPLTLFFSFNTTLAILDLWPLHGNFRISL